MTLCNRCQQRPAVACDECRRALAFLDHASGFGSIARHPEQGISCRLCEQGEAELCVECLCQGVLEARSAPDSPYAGPTPAQFEAQEQRAGDEITRVAEMNEQLGADVAQSFYTRTPADRGPSWYRMIGAGR